MFAYVYYVLDKQLAKVPVSYIKRFDYNNYKGATCIYKVFWSRLIHAIQNEEDSNAMEKLKTLQEPPSKISWNVPEGEGYYSAYVLRVEGSLDDLIQSLKNKRPNLPSVCAYESSSTTEDEVALEKNNKKQEVAEIKRCEQVSKRVRAEGIFKAAKRSRKGIFDKLDFDESDDASDDNDPEVIPKTLFDDMKASYHVLEKEKEKVEKKLEESNKKYENLQEYTAAKKELEEVIQLRYLNRQLQERILELTKGGCFPAINNISASEESISKTTEVELGAGVFLSKEIYEEIFDLDHVRKFTKSLAVAIWGTSTLAVRSVTGKPCRNRNGPKKVSSDSSEANNSQKETKPPLTPEKLSIISGQMRQYLMKRGKTLSEIEDELKNRNRYLSDKIQDICLNVSKRK